MLLVCRKFGRNVVALHRLRLRCATITTSTTPTSAKPQEMRQISHRDKMENGHLVFFWFLPLKIQSLKLANIFAKWFFVEFLNWASVKWHKIKTVCKRSTLFSVESFDTYPGIIFRVSQAKSQTQTISLKVLTQDLRIAFLELVTSI